MTNPMLQAMQSRQPQQNNPLQIFQQVKELQAQLQSQGKTPQEVVMNLLSNGQMSQSQFEQLQQQAKSILNMK